MSLPDPADATASRPDAALAAGASAASLAVPADPICPHLRGAGAWRSAAPSREHRCAAMAPPVRVATEKQARLCLSPSHPTCATFEAARAARAAAGLPLAPAGRPLARTIVTVTESARPPLLRRVGSALRRSGQAAVGVLMVVALVAVVVARLEPGSAGPAASQSAATSADPSQTPTASTPPAPSTTPTADPTGTPRPSARPTASPAATPASTPRPTPTRAPTTYLRYTVQVGDTLYSIAARFGSTVAAIVDANNITNAAYVRAGDILLIPR